MIGPAPRASEGAGHNRQSSASSLQNVLTGLLAKPGGKQNRSTHATGGGVHWSPTHRFGSDGDGKMNTTSLASEPLNVRKRSAVLSGSVDAEPSKLFTGAPLYTLRT